MHWRHYARRVVTQPSTADLIAEFGHELRRDREDLSRQLLAAIATRLPQLRAGPELERLSEAAASASMEAQAATIEHGLDVEVVQAGNMLTGGPAKTAAALSRRTAAMTDEQRTLYGEAFGNFTDALNSMQSAGLSAEASADRVIELIQQVPAPSRAPLGVDAEEALRLVREKTDAELDAARLKLIGLDAS